MIRKEDLDKRICDLEKDATNPETYREFIRHSEKEFEIVPMDLDSMSEERLNKYLDFVDDLWNK